MAKGYFHAGQTKMENPTLLSGMELEVVLSGITVGFQVVLHLWFNLIQSSNWFLAAGDDHMIKVWDMDNADIFAVINANGDLPARPYVCLNKNGTVLAVSAYHNQIKVLANDLGYEFLRTSAFVFGDSRSITESFRKVDVDPIPIPLKAGIEEGHVPSEGTLDALKIIKPKRPAISNEMEMDNIYKVVGVSRCQSLLFTSQVKTNQIWRLVYTNAGNGILALAEDGVHVLWKWVKRDFCLSGEERFLSHLIIREDDHFVQYIDIQDNNIIAVGMEDSIILIYNIRIDEIISKLEGHSKRISGLAFSTTSNLLVSAGVDTQISIGSLASDASETNVEFDNEQKQLVAVYETQHAIYETSTLRCLKQLIYAAMRDRTLLILGASDLTPRFQIDPSAYQPPHLIIRPAPDASGLVDQPL